MEFLPDAVPLVVMTTTGSSDLSIELAPQNSVLGEPTADELSRAVSVVMPVLNEEQHLADAVQAVLSQEFDGEVELILALGPSTDQTDRIASDLADADPRVRLVMNPTGKTPSGLNAAIGIARFPVVVRVDGHCELPPDYLDQAVSTLQRTGADNVGGIMQAVGKSPWEAAVAVAMTSRLGVGGASFHVGGSEGETLTVYLGAFRATTLRAVGGYDDRFDRAQDWEMNYRIRKSGGRVWFNPAMSVTYRPRSTARALAKQYFQYGQWRREVMRRYPDTVSLRYAAAPTLVLGLAGGATVAAVGSAVKSRQLVALGLAAPIGYALLAAVGGWAISRGEDPLTRRRVPLALATMHVSWGIGFLTSRRKVK